MNNLTEAVQNIKSEFQIKPDGQVKVSIRGAARLFGINEMSIVRGGDFSSKRLAQVLVPHGFKAADFSKDGIPDIALALMAKYFAYKANRTTPQAEAICDAFMAVGIRAWVHEQLGWQKSPATSPQRQHLWWDRIALFQKHTQIPHGYWTVFMELAYMWMKIEGTGYVFPEKACLDISVGKCWSNYLRSQGYNLDEFDYYPHHYPDHRGIQDARMYPNELLGTFRDWLAATYTENNFPCYMQRYCDKHEYAAIASAVTYARLQSAS